MTAQSLRLGILADSLGLPRDHEGEKVGISDTYPELVREYLLSNKPKHTLYVNARRSRQMFEALAAWNGEYRLFDLTHLVVQVGVVDSAPRIFTLREKRLLQMLRPRSLSRYIIQTASANRAALVKARQKTYSRLSDFKVAVEKLAALVTVTSTRLAFVPILPTHETLEARSPGFNENVRLYNAAIDAAATAHGAVMLRIDKMTMIDDFLLQDGIHINNIGSREFAGKIYGWIESTSNEVTFCNSGNGLCPRWVFRTCQ